MAKKERKKTKKPVTDDIRSKREKNRKNQLNGHLENMTIRDRNLDDQRQFLLQEEFCCQNVTVALSIT